MPTFAEDLRAWRKRRGVSQIDLALRAGTTQRHLSFIESGRSAPGRAMVIRLAESLQVPLRERNTLLLSAGYAPAYEETDWSANRLAPIRKALNRVLQGHNPYPAIVVDRQGTLLSANESFTLITEGAAEHLLTPPVNIPRLLLHPAGVAPRIVNLAEWSWHIIDALRRHHAENPTPALPPLIRELTTYTPPRPTHPSLGFAVPLHLKSTRGDLHLLTTLSHFGTAVDVTLADLRMEAFLPADEPTANALTNTQTKETEKSAPTANPGSTSSRY